MPLPRKLLIAGTAACCFVTVGLAPSYRADAQTYYDGSRTTAVEAGGGANQAVREFYVQVSTYAAWYAEQERIFVAALVVAEQQRIAAEQRAAEAARQAELARQRAAVPRPAPQASTPAPSGGSCYGGTPLSNTLVTNESGGNPNAYNHEGSGAWGCFQIMPDTWNSLCGGFGTYGSASVDAQKKCATEVYRAQGRGAWTAAG